MTRFFKEIRFSELEEKKKFYEQAGASVRVFPLREKGLNQSNYRKLEIEPPTGNKYWDYVKKTRGKI